MNRQKIAILGSTGSIGVQTLDVIKENPDLFEARILTANNQWELLAKQAVEFDVDTVIIANKEYYPQLKEALANQPIKVFAGEEAITQIVGGNEVDVVVNALVGYAGLHPTVAAIEAGKKIALANKESLVVGGEYVMRLAKEKGVPILPIDSEHSAIFQCLVGERSPIKRLIITCSGGSLRNIPMNELHNITIAQTLNHPQWDMGAKITVDSSTLVNKGFEIIEAHWLFGIEPSKIDVLIHPQSIVHSMVEFEDGAIKAQLGTPDMRIPISYSLMFPHRANSNCEPFDFIKNSSLTFSEVDRVKYPAIDMAYETLRRGGTASCTMNGANEVAVAAFLNKKCEWLDIVRTIEHSLEHATFIPKPTLDHYAQSNSEARELARKFLKI